MKFITIIHRRLREGKTFDDYRKAWFHATGFGAPTTMYTVVNAFDPQEIISVAVGGGDGGDFERMKTRMEAVLAIDVRERNASPLDDIVEDTIIRHFGLVIAEDDFSPAGPLAYVPPAVDGEVSDYGKFVQMSAELARLIQAAAKKRDDLTRRRRGDTGNESP
ncbi:MAG TPA: ROK family protein [bacterium]|nr:ROK family protein [bacterium]